MPSDVQENENSVIFKNKLTKLKSHNNNDLQI